MTNDICTIGLTRTELQTLKVLFPITFSISSVEADTLDEHTTEHIVNQARCIILNPKRLSVSQLTDLLYAQDELRIRYKPVPVILFSDTMTREQNRAIPMPEYPIMVIDLHKRIDRNRSVAIKLLREATLPCWQNREKMLGNGLNDGWYLIDIETTGTDCWNDNIIAIYISYMANFETKWEDIIYIKHPEPLSDEVANLTGITDEMLSHGITLDEAIDKLDALSCKNTPFVFTNEDFMTGFLNAAYLRCRKHFTRPYIAIDKLAQVPFGYLMQRKALNIPAYADPESAEEMLMNENLQQLYALTKCTFDSLRNRYDVHCPAHFNKLYAAEMGV